MATKALHFVHRNQILRHTRQSAGREHGNRRRTKDWTARLVVRGVDPVTILESAWCLVREVVDWYLLGIMK